mgnify:CR=1 FL=1
MERGRHSGSSPDSHLASLPISKDMWSATLHLGLAPIHRVLNEGVRGPIYSVAEVNSSGSCKGTQPLSWLKLHAKGRLEGLQSGAGRPPLGRPA